MRILETLVPVGFVVVMIICFLQGRYEAQRPKRPGRARNRPSVLPVATMTESADDGTQGSTGLSADPFLTAEIPRDWLQTALHGLEAEAHHHSMDWPGEGHQMGSLAADHHESVNASDPFHDFGLINPATGLPMLGDGPTDIAGNRFGENDSQDHWSSQDHDNWSSDFNSPSNSTSSWDDYR
jgi:hypothetical protein